jgi:hypothetical protein
MTKLSAKAVCGCRGLKSNVVDPGQSDETRKKQFRCHSERQRSKEKVATQLTDFREWSQVFATVKSASHPSPLHCWLSTRDQRDRISSRPDGPLRIVLKEGVLSEERCGAPGLSAVDLEVPPNDYGV